MFVIILFSILVLIIINVFYRILINQDEVLSIKDKMKELEEESKKHKNDPQKTKEYFSKMMDENRKLTKLSLKPMLISFLIVMIFLPIISIIYVDYSVQLTNSTGNVTIDNFYFVNVQNNTVELLKNDSLMFSCETPCLKEVDGKHFKLQKESIERDGKKEDVVRMSRIVAMSPVTIPFIGRELGWIWIYIIFSIPMTILIKKLMGVKI